MHINGHILIDLFLNDLDWMMQEKKQRIRTSDRNIWEAYGNMSNANIS